MTKAFPLLFLLKAAVLPLVTLAQLPEGWKMTDRWIGFRYEMTGRVQSVGMRHAIQAKADELACFGWVQNKKTKSIVGEVRCNISNGKKMEEWIRSIKNHPPGSFVENVDIKHYEDTKIKLHFSHFKIVEDARDTCFREHPHRCNDFEDET
eukprot:CAMPEP_0172482818 /NCGR_PEP_ID=MMETSP1066-20121228/9440_1 /TAXON_ID=671091 /ORGANISM="Coscinodiscus wailesii, Strain CCMP2513" /LENGTH=150 /DNA_ID=CAMNT_0013246247 /DNA_START=53 /DNA_END=505 /DNA_ORIENTATION=-